MHFLLRREIIMKKIFVAALILGLGLLGKIQGMAEQEVKYIDIIENNSDNPVDVQMIWPSLEGLPSIGKTYREEPTVKFEPFTIATIPAKSTFTFAVPFEIMSTYGSDPKVRVNMEMGIDWDYLRETGAMKMGKAVIKELEWADLSPRNRINILSQDKVEVV